MTATATLTAADRADLCWYAAGREWHDAATGWVYLTDRESALLYRPDGRLYEMGVRGEARLATEDEVYEVARGLGIDTRRFQGAWDILEKAADMATEMYDAALAEAKRADDERFATDDDWDGENGEWDRVFEAGEAAFDVHLILAGRGYVGAVVTDHAPCGTDHETMIIWDRRYVR